jgi:hypothetical protein
MIDEKCTKKNTLDGTQISAESSGIDRFVGGTFTSMNTWDVRHMELHHHIDYKKAMSTFVYVRRELLEKSVYIFEELWHIPSSYVVIPIDRLKLPQVYFVNGIAAHYA